MLLESTLGPPEAAVALITATTLGNAGSSFRGTRACGCHFDCVDELEWLAPEVGSFEQSYLINVFSGGKTTPAVGSSVRLCKLFDTDAGLLGDADCSAPVDPTTGVKVADADGFVVMQHRNRFAPGGRPRSWFPTKR